MGTEDMQPLMKTVIAGIILVSLHTKVRTEPKADDIHIHIHLDEMGEGRSIKERGNDTLGSSKMKKGSKKSGDYSFMDGARNGGFGKNYAESNIPTNEDEDDDELPSPCKSRQTGSTPKPDPPVSTTSSPGELCLKNDECEEVCDGETVAGLKILGFAVLIVVLRVMFQ